MSFEALKKEILAEAERESAAVAQRLKEQQEALEQRITQKARQIEERLLAEGKLNGEREARHLHQEMELEARSQVLIAKQKEIEKTQAELLQQLLDQSESAQKKLLESLLSLLPKVTGTIAAGEHHQKLLHELVKTPYRLTEEVIPREGGFKFQSAEVEMNLTLSQLVAQLFDKERSAVARILFG